jgi:hypothetical protein
MIELFESILVCVSISCGYIIKNAWEFMNTMKNESLFVTGESEDFSDS